MKFAPLCCFLLLAAATAPSVHAAVTVCPKIGSIQQGLQYHADSQCDRASFNRFKCSIGRSNIYNAFKQIGGVSAIANEKTVKCPPAGARVPMRNEHQPASGLDTVFFFENRASTPIVISYVTAEGMEVSAKNPKISPAHADPHAILQPGSFMAVYAFEGHEFAARELLKTGVAGGVLLQHRAGLIPVGEHAIALECPADDIEPMVNQTTAPEFQRTPTIPFRPCNTMDIGFRNAASCPLHAYYVHGEGESCQETFKFHLGTESVTKDYMHDWVSQTKYEGTFIGHTFHFRLAANPAVLVDTITLQPVIVTDCPKSSVAVPVAVQGDALLQTIGRLDRVGANETGGFDIDFAIYHNSTFSGAAAHTI